MQWRKCKVITRDFLMNADCKTAFGAIEESLLWSAEQRAASLAATLACRPDEGPVWIFGYGSLMWNPALEFTESCTGTLVGWHRAFCLRLTAGRGTAHQPGRMLALKEGGRTTGVAYRLPEETLEQELTLLFCCSRFMSALDDASSSGCQYLLVEEIKTKMAAGCYPCGRFRAHIAITAA